MPCSAVPPADISQTNLDCPLHLDAFCGRSTCTDASAGAVRNTSEYVLMHDLSFLLLGLAVRQRKVQGMEVPCNERGQNCFKEYKLLQVSVSTQA